MAIRLTGAERRAQQKLLAAFIPFLMFCLLPIACVQNLYNRLTAKAPVVAPVAAVAPVSPPRMLAEPLAPSYRPAAPLASAAKPETPETTDAPFVYSAARVEAESEPAKSDMLSGLLLPRYRVTRTGGQTLLATAYTKVPPWYVFTDLRGKKINNLVASVETIESLTPAEAAAEAEKESRRTVTIAERVGPSPRIEAKIEARSAARLEARMRPPDPFPVATFSGSSGGGARWSGGGVHVGPRGGVYHYSASGNKVYHKH